MQVIGRRHYDAINALLLLEHLAVILIDFCFGIFLERVGRMSSIHIAKRDNVFAVQLIQIVPALAANSHAC